MKKTIVKTGVVAEFEGKYWGIVYQDGKCCSEGFTDIEKAHVADPEYCKAPVHMSYAGSYDCTRLRKAKLVNIKITTTYETEE